MPAPLSDADSAVLAFEEAWPRHSGAKDEAIRARFGRSAVAYYLRLDRLIDTEDALAHDPILVGRLRRIRDAHLAERAQRVSG